MRRTAPLRTLVLSASLIGAAVARPVPLAAAIPPGRQHVLTIEGDTTVTFVPQARLAPVRIDYRARVEYIVHSRTGPDALTKADLAVRKKSARSKSAAKARRKDAEDPAGKVAAALDVSVHSSESRFRQNGQTVVESKLSRSRFQGRIQPEAPIVDVAANQAPPRLQEVLEMFDSTAATILLDEDSRVVDRRVRNNGPFRALVETLLSIHTPIPRDVGSWEAPTQLAMGQGQTAKGTLRFEKIKEPEGVAAGAGAGGLVKVKVSGVLKAEGIVVGTYVKDGKYTVTGDQTYDPASREWRASKWSVAVENELANANGQTVANARGTMTVESRSTEESATPASGKTSAPGP